jgi:2-methylaconitate cis-trans-isomerase PrpF
MQQTKIPAAFIRGGTSKAVVFHSRDLPADPAERDRFFLAAMGSPDPYGRQLDGMGGGVSSLSKICIVGPSSHPDADIDYTKAQIQLKEARVDYHANCGNMSSAMGPFAVDEGLFKVESDGEVLVRIYNTNTRKLIHARFDVADGQAAVDGDLVIPGVAGSGAPVSLAFLDPGGASTGKLLPTGHVKEMLDVPGHGTFEVSMIDAANACVFLHARDLGLTGAELPADIDAVPGLLEKLSAIRCAASVAMGITADTEAATKKSVPIIGWVADPQPASLLTGQQIEADAVDVTARMISNGQPHRALPLTASLCLSVAARIEGSVVHDHTRRTNDPHAKLRIAMPSGILVTAAAVGRQDGKWRAEQCTLMRTQRRLFDGYVYARASALTAK